jgi:hypothetical protein
MISDENSKKFYLLQNMVLVYISKYSLIKEWNFKPQHKQGDGA